MDAATVMACNPAPPVDIAAMIMKSREYSYDPVPMAYDPVPMALPTGATQIRAATVSGCALACSRPSTVPHEWPTR
jgi:hypothetical protein